jgi:4-hydroxybenzoate polyprenyltransferase
MTAAPGRWRRLQATAGALRLPWPSPHASAWRVPLVFLGASLGAAPRGATLSSIAWRLIALQACALSGLLATVLLNDVADRNLDKIAHPGRPLARGDVRLADAAALCAILYVVTLATAALLERLLFLLIVLWLVLVASHYFFFKRHPVGSGGALYSDLITPAQFSGLGVLVYLGLQQHDVIAMGLLCGIIYFCDASMNVLQGIQDREGDAAFGVSTLAARHGPAVAARAALLLHACVLPFALAYAFWADLGVVWGAGAVLLWLAVARVVRQVAAGADAARVGRGVAATALMLQLLLIGAGVVKAADYVTARTGMHARSGAATRVAVTGALTSVLPAPRPLVPGGRSSAGGGGAR